MATRTVEIIIAPRTPHFVGDGFRVHNFIPGIPYLSMQRMSPFLVMDYNSKYHFPVSQQPKGVGVHPHKGFETVTIAYKGSISHHDSSGGGGTIEEGDVQWMTAASGILHKEYHSDEFSKTGGLFQMVQLWVNLPAKDKKSEPKYQSLQNARIPRFSLENHLGEVEIIAGEYNGISGGASTFTPVNLFNAKLKKGAAIDFSFPKHYNTFFLVIEGVVTINNNEEVPTDYLALLKNDGEDFSIQASEDAVVLILSGEPIAEPIAAH